MGDDYSSHALPADARVLDEAAAWLAHLHSGAATESDRQAHHDWCRRDPAHADAWGKAQMLLQSFQGLPAGLGKTAFARRPANSRRLALGKLAALMVVVPGSAWLAWKTLPFLEWSADLRTATGEQKTFTLADGSEVTLNTSSAVDVRFDQDQRLLLLRGGEVLIQTATDKAQSPRPFFVDTTQGRIRALGTRFTVRQHEASTQVGVLEHAVEILTRSGAKKRIEAGQRARYSASSIDSAAPVEGAANWSRGIFAANQMRLAEVVDELARYRSGVLRCHPAVADLRISGVFPLNDTGYSLALIADTFGLRVEQHTRFWTSIGPR